ncbi:MAG: PPC domain-containing protein, partial [Elainellaceae cyanobacterium]
MRRRDLAKNKLNQAKSIALGSKRQVFKDFVNSQDQNDLFRFRASGSTNVKLKLRGLKDNADLQIFAPKTTNRDVRRNIGKTNWSRLSGAKIRQFLTPVARSRKAGRSG